MSSYLETYRIRGVPLSWDEERLRAFLLENDPACEPSIEPLWREVNGQNLTATATFKHTPRGLLEEEKKWDMKVPAGQARPTGRPQWIEVDRDFYGMTTLFAPSPDDHKVDIIAISGLGNHAFGSFKKKGGEFMWLRDSLPYDIVDPDSQRFMARVVIYGYDTSLRGRNSSQNWETFATSFHTALLQFSSSARPIVFIAHSFGGLIVKEVLINLSKSELLADRNLLKQVYGVSFFGVPHAGMEIKSLIPMTGDGPNRFLLESIGRVSDLPTKQRREFQNALGDKGQSEIIYFYGTKHSRTLLQGPDSEWVMEGTEEWLVDNTSATLGRSWEQGPEHICAMDRSHSDLVKFSANDPDLGKVRVRLQGLCHRSLTAQRRIESGRKFVVPYNTNHRFIDRPSIMNRLKAYFGHGQPANAEQKKSLSRVSLYGLGGSGKTQLAIAYTHWLRSTCPDLSIFWLHASNPDLLRESLQTLARDCEIEGFQDPSRDLIDLVRPWLECKANGPWLIVVDNIDDDYLLTGNPGKTKDGAHQHTINSFRRLIADCPHGSMLFTTRSKKLGLDLMRDGPLQVDRMEEEESRILLRSMLVDHVPSDDDACVLSSRLEWLPLAIAQAAAFITANSITVSKYIEYLDKSNDNLMGLLSEEFEAEGQHWESQRRAVAQTWMISFEQIEKENSIAAEFLSLMAFFNPQNIPQSFLWAYATLPLSTRTVALSHLDFTKAIGVLTGYCLLTVNKSGGFDVHRLVHLVTRKWLLQTGRAYLYYGYALLSLGGSREDDSQGDREGLQLGSQANVPHYLSVIGHHIEPPLEDQAKYGSEHLLAITGIVKAQLCYMLGVDGRLDEAEGLGAQAVLILTKAFGDDHKLTLGAAMTHTQILQSLEQWPEAEARGEELLDISRRKYGEINKETIEVRYMLGKVYMASGRLVEGEKLMLDVLEVAKSTGGEDHPTTLAVRKHLADIWSHQGRHVEAKKALDQTMQKYAEQDHDGLSTDGNVLAAFMFSMAFALKMADDFEKALPIAELSSQAFANICGPRHPSTLETNLMLAALYSENRRPLEACKLCEEVARRALQVLGLQHPRTIFIFVKLALLRSKLGSKIEGGQLSTVCIRRCWNLLGSRHSITKYSIRVWIIIRGLRMLTPEEKSQASNQLLAALYDPYDSLLDFVDGTSGSRVRESPATNSVEKQTDIGSLFDRARMIFRSSMAKEEVPSKKCECVEKEAVVDEVIEEGAVEQVVVEKTGIFDLDDEAIDELIAKLKSSYRPRNMREACSA